MAEPVPVPVPLPLPLQLPLPRHDVQLSKTLSWILRHQAVRKGLAIREDGYVPCRQVVSFLAKRCIPGMTQAKLEGQVAVCPKRRFELTPCKTYIRASRGHSIRSIEDTKLLTEITDAADIRDAVYGTSEKSWNRIRTSGLHCGSRNHIHIATRDSRSGYTVSKANGVLINIDTARAMADGVKFFVAANGVLATRGVENSGVLPATYFLRAVQNNQDGSVTDLDLVVPGGGGGDA